MDPKNTAKVKTLLEELLSCPIDNEPYDLIGRKPILLNNCGHAICKNCYDMLSEKICPFCRLKFTAFFNNYGQISKMETIEMLIKILYENKPMVCIFFSRNKIFFFE